MVTGELRRPLPLLHGQARQESVNSVCQPAGCGGAKRLLSVREGVYRAAVDHSGMLPNSRYGLNACSVFPAGHTPYGLSGAEGLVKTSGRLWSTRAHLLTGTQSGRYMTSVPFTRGPEDTPADAPEP